MASWVRAAYTNQTHIALVPLHEVLLALFDHAIAVLCLLWQEARHLTICAHPAGSSADGYAKSMCVAAFAAGLRPAVLNYRCALHYGGGLTGNLFTR